MARTRLSNEKRAILRGLAKKVVAETPINPIVEKRVKKAIKLHTELRVKMAAVAVQIRNTTFSTQEEKTLNKFDLVKAAQTTLRFIELDTGRIIEIPLFNNTAYDEQNAPAEGFESLGYEATEKYETTKTIVKEACEVTIPSARSEYQIYSFQTTKQLIKLYGQCADARTELNMAQQIDKDTRHVIMRDFDALISGCRTFEDVVDVWPEAVQLTDRICGTGEAVSLISDQAKARIMANMATRKVL
jgi:hypothetical protein